LIFEPAGEDAGGLRYVWAQRQGCAAGTNADSQGVRARGGCVCFKGRYGSVLVRQEFAVREEVEVTRRN
jgi:hypothetical protein